MIDAAQVRELLDYDPDTGALIWRRREARNRHERTWNARWAGKPAFTYSGKNVYLRGAILGRNYLAHRVAWAVYYGRWPAGLLDHINGVRTDNRIANLRECTAAENGRNQPRRPGSPFKGIRRFGHRWHARITVDGREIHLGTYATAEQAAQAYDAAAPAFHGEYARLNFAGDPA